MEDRVDYGPRASFTDASALPRLLGEPRRRNVIRVVPGVYESAVGTISGVSLCSVVIKLLDLVCAFCTMCVFPIDREHKSLAEPYGFLQREHVFLKVPTIPRLQQNQCKLSCFVTCRLVDG